MRQWFAPLLLAAGFILGATPAPPARAQAETRAYAPEDLRTLSRRDQERVIRLEYREQSRGRDIPDDQLRFYIDQVNQSNWTFSRIKQDIARSLAGSGGPQPPVGGSTVRCESSNGRSRTCDTGWAGRARLVKQLSSTRCVEGSNWTSSPGRVTVHGGCRADFGPLTGPAPGREIRCESTDNRRRECAMGVAGSARLVRQLSSTRCTEGSNWGTRGSTLWVDRGCRGVFEVSGGAGSGYTVTCASERGRTSTCAWDARQGRPFLQQQLSSASCREGSTWSYRGNAIQVSGGCRGLFGAR